MYFHCKVCSKEEKEIVDLVIDRNAVEAKVLNRSLLRNVYRKGLIYFDIPIHDDDFIVGQ